MGADMSRLLHAAARGARIEAFPRQKKWITLTHISIVPNKHAYRIHPDDEHLQYGPVSTALREMSKQPKTMHHKGVNLPHFGFTIFASTENELLEVLRCDGLTHSLFLLLVAETLADEGM
jgi:hypothetical protein